MSIFRASFAEQINELLQFIEIRGFAIFNMLLLNDHGNCFKVFLAFFLGFLFGLY